MYAALPSLGRSTSVRPVLASAAPGAGAAGSNWRGRDEDSKRSAAGSSGPRRSKQQRQAAAVEAAAEGRPRRPRCVPRSLAAFPSSLRAIWVLGSAYTSASCHYHALAQPAERGRIVAHSAAACRAPVPSCPVSMLPPCRQKSPDETPLRDANRDRLMGLLTERWVLPPCLGWP